MRRTMIMLLMCAVALLPFSCVSRLEDEVVLLRNRVTALESMAGDINSQIETVNALFSRLAANDYIESVQEISEGVHVITFSSKEALIIRDGQDGTSPVIGLKYDSATGHYCWTVKNGNDPASWMLDDKGNKLTADATVPKLRIHDGFWQVSYDNGINWANLFESMGEEGRTIFKSIDWSDPYCVTFNLTDGTSFSLQTMACIEVLSARCDSLNSAINSYSTLATSIDPGIFISSVTEIMDGNRLAGYSFKFENGAGMTILNGVEKTDAVWFNIAQDPADGKYYWQVKYDEAASFDWLTSGGVRMTASPYDGNPRVGIRDSLGLSYFTVSYDEGRSWSLLTDPSGNPVTATASTSFNFFKDADVYDDRVVLTTLSGEKISLARTREKILYLDLPASFEVFEDSTYSFNVFVRDTVVGPSLMDSYDEYRSAVPMNLVAMGMDGAVVTANVPEPQLFKREILNVDMTAHIVECVYTSAYRITARVGQIQDSRLPVRVVFFLQWDDCTVMKVLELKGGRLQ